MFVCLFAGVLLQSFFPVALEVEVFYCRNEYFWIYLLMPSSLIFRDPIRLYTQLPWLQHHLEVSSLQDYSHSIYIHFQGKHLYRAGEMENTHPFRPHILTVHCHS